MKPSPNYQYMAEEVSKRYIANRWWVDCTPEKIFEIVDDADELKEWFISALYADQVPKKAREGQVVEFDRDGFIDRCMFLRGKWTLVDTRPDYLR